MAAALVAAGSIVSAGGSLHEGNAAAAAAEHNAHAARMNAAASVNAANEQERRFRISTRKQIGEARANYGASGVQLEGSPLDALEESASNAELDALTIRHSGQQKAWGYNADADLYEFQAHNARVQGTLNAASSLLSGGSKIAGK